MPVNRKQKRFLLQFALLLVLFYLATAIQAVDAAVVTPFTRGLAHVSAVLLKVIGEPVVMQGTIIYGGGFAVDIKNGCNGIEALVFLCAAMLAFDAPLRTRLTGILIGASAIQALNIVRIVSLYLLGRYHREWFDAFHLAIWQTMIFGAAMMIFLAWTARVQRTYVAARS